MTSFPMPAGPVADVLIVAHGSPADPEPQEAAMKALAVRVAMRLPGWRVRGATLAAPGALENGLARLTDPMIYPFFMAEGWFTRTALPKRLAAAGAAHLAPLPAFGSDPGLPALVRALALTACHARGWPPGDTTLLLAAHGSQVSRASALATEGMAETLRAGGDFAAIPCGFVEEAPHLADAAHGLPERSLCLPLFALSAGHVTGDVPEALETAGFSGVLLPPVGAAAGVADLVAGGLLRARAPMIAGA